MSWSFVFSVAVLGVLFVIWSHSDRRTRYHLKNLAAKNSKPLWFIYLVMISGGWIPCFCLYVISFLNQLFKRFK